MRTLVRRFSLAERADVSCCGMTVAQAATLEALAHVPALRLGDLGRALGIRPSTLTRNLVRLEDKGLVARGPDPDDRRAAIVALTSEGRRAAAEIERQEEELAEEILSALPPGSGPGTVAALENLVSAVRAATEACCPGAFDHLLAPGHHQTWGEDDVSTREERRNDPARSG
jgi:DNA-binding MarR family transcriptional regulator